MLISFPCKRQGQCLVHLSNPVLGQDTAWAGFLLPRQWTGEVTSSNRAPGKMAHELRGGLTSRCTPFAAATETPPHRPGPGKLFVLTACGTAHQGPGVQVTELCREPQIIFRKSTPISNLCRSFHFLAAHFSLAFWGLRSERGGPVIDTPIASHVPGTRPLPLHTCHRWDIGPILQMRTLKLDKRFPTPENVTFFPSVAHARRLGIIFNRQIINY